MTVVTKPLSDKKDEKEHPIEQVSLDLSTSPADHEWMIPKPHNRTSGITLLILSVFALLVVGVGILSGFYVYQQYARPQVRHFKAWRNIPYEQALVNQREWDNMDRLFANDLADDLMSFRMQFFKEKFEIGDDFEKIDVPDFKDGRPSRYIHDFGTNKTGIIDPLANRCFVMDLDRESVLPPMSMMDLLDKMFSGNYNMDMSTVKRSMRAELPAVADVTQFGPMIGEECRSKRTYKLVPNDSHLVKRDTHTSPIAFAQFAGKYIEQISIDNLDDVPT